MSGLSVNDLISAQVLLSPTAAQTQGFGALLLMGSSAVIDVSQRFRSYSSLSQVTADFGSGAPETTAATAFFAQSPQPATLYIGRWAATASSGLLHGATLSATQQALSNFTAVTSGGFQASIDGSNVSLTGLNFSAATTLNGVASIITTGLGSHGSCAWNSVYSRFEITSASSGTSSSVGFASAPVSGTDISTLIGGTSAAGAQAVAGIAAETLLSAVTTLANMTNAWYGLAIAATSGYADSDLLAVGSFCEALSPKRLFMCNTQESAALNASLSTDIASQTQAAALTHTACQYSSTSPYAAVSLFARQATVNFSASNTTITLMYKQEPGIAAETLTETQAAALKQKNCNVFVNYNNSTAIVQWGTVASGQYIDTIVASDWLQNALQTALYNALYTSTTKIPMTDQGVNMLVSVAAGVLAQAAANGFIAPGVWNGPNIGKIVTGQTLTKGFYLYAPPVSTLTSSQRSARQAPVIQAAIIVAGAIHTASMIVNVSQ